MTRNVPVAVIGMGCFFPKSSGIKQYWRLLFKGMDAVCEVPPTHWSAGDYFNEDPGTPDHVYCKRGGFISRVPFDPTEFGIPPASLEATDTSQLLGLIAAKTALENAGYTENKTFDRSKVSVILGATGTQELVIPLGARLGHPHWRKALQSCGITGSKADEIVRKISESYVSWQENSFPGLLGNVIAGRICNRLNLGGTNCAVDAACASSISAVHLALLELASHKSDLVVTGGVDTLNDIFMHMCFAKTRILSPTGDARPFSRDADGTVLGEGIGMVVLKRLDDARRDGDRIYAVIKGIGTSSDGKSQSIYAPRSEGQIRALRAAYDQAGIDPSTVELVEAHGTGTRVGDRVEFKALSKVFGKVSDNSCALGSVKSNIGHTKAAAGAAGLIKAVLALHHKVLPPTLKADIPDPDLNIQKSPFYLNTRSRPWIKNRKHPRRAGVSAFGFGGSNFHVVLEEYDHKKSEPSWHGAVDIFAASASDRNHLEKQLYEFRQLAEKNSCAEIMHMAAKSRERFSHKDPLRLAFPFNPESSLPGHINEVEQMLSRYRTDHFQKNRGFYFGGPHRPGKLAFVFPGQGSQYVNMGCDLICMFPEALEFFEKAEGFYSGISDMQPLRDYIYPKIHTGDSGENKKNDDQLRQTAIAQPAIGVISSCLSGILKRFNVIPEVVCGHSFGELTALWSAGRICDDDFLTLSLLRGQLMAQASNGRDGAMTAVKAPLDTLEKLITEAKIDVVIANKNSREQSVLSGYENHIAEAETLCRKKGFAFRRLPVSAAFHTSMMKSARDGFHKAISRIRFQRSDTPVFSNITGKLYPDTQENIRSLLADQIISPVEFAAEIENMVRSGVKTFLEVGPKKVLTDLIQTIVGDFPDCHVMAMDNSCGNNDGCDDLAHVLCQLAALGHPVRLDRWEQAPEHAVRKQKMSIAISGANIRVASKKPKENIPDKKMAVTEKIKTHSEKLNPSENHVYSEPVTPADVGDASDKPYRYQQKMMKDQNKIAPDQIQNALNVVRDGMKSMQALQMQTAEAHKKFLETQTETGRMLQQMMAHTQQLAATVMGINVEAMSPVFLNKQTPGITDTSGQSMPQAPEIRETETETKKNHFQHAAVSADSGPVPESRQVTNIPPETGSYPYVPRQQQDVKSHQNNHLTNALLEVVSELTGYPTEMLGLDMDIESDLGIDSIKRVEILSALEEKMPELPPVSPEQMGRLKTLGQIIGHLTGGKNDLIPEFPGHRIDSPDNEAPENTGHITGELLNIVAELTGYPSEMLGLDMDIESDLGIDSIKRVEILSALEERIPDIPRVSPEIMGKMRTLGQISAHLMPQSPRVPDKQNPDGPQGPSVSNRKDTIEQSVLDVVCQLTGYPVEMLGLDMDIESDLGIDSIKRVEILSVLEAKIPDIPTVTPDQMGKLKTLGQIVDYLRKDQSGTLQNHDNISTINSNDYSQNLHAEHEIILTDDAALNRQVVVAEDDPLEAGNFLKFPVGRKLLVAGCDKELSGQIIEEFSRHHVDAQTIAMDSYKGPEELPKASGLVILSNHDVDKKFLLDTLMLAKTLSGNLKDSALESCGLFAAVSFLDGGFGFSRKRFSNPEQGGLAGLVKTAALEWSGVTCRTLDVDPDIKDPRQLSHRIVSELLNKNAGKCVETGLGINRRVKPGLVPAPIYNSPLRIGSGDVMVVTGGARGITARTVLSLAEEAPAIFILLGRSPVPDSSPDWLSDLEDDHAIKKAIIRHMSEKTVPTPTEVERFFRRHKAAEEIRKNLYQISRTGAVVRYVSTDVCDEKAVFDLMEKIRSEFGPVRGIIHGAGVLEDRLIKDKTEEQFIKVFDTKVRGLKNLLKACKEPLDCLVFFSSVAARFGNTGQADYAMANEVLNKIACLESLARPECRVVSINWGPWDGGMVTDSVKKAFAGKNIPLIPMETGGKAMVMEVRAPAGSPVEVVIGAPINEHLSDSVHDGAIGKGIDNRLLPSQKSLSDEFPLSLTFKRELDLEKCPVLGSHILGGKPVVPFALMTEWLGCGALHENPGLVLQGLDKLHVLNGIKLEQDKKTIRLMAGKARKIGDTFEVDVEIRDGFKDGVEVIHSRARAILGDNLPEAPFFDKSVYTAEEGFSKDIRDIYDQILFHGVQLQGIRKIFTCNAGYMAAEISCAPAPDQWMKNPVRSRWIADPLVLDCAFQMAIIWSFEQKGMVCLPSYSESYRQYRARFPEGSITAVLKIHEVSNRKLRGDFTFLDQQDTVVAQLFGYEALMDPKLKDRF